MADEPELQTETTGEATQPEVKTEATEQATEAQTQTTETPEPKVEEPQEDWRDKEIKRKHAKLKEHERETERLRKENEDLRALAQARADGKETPPERQAPDKSQDEIQRAARALRDQERYQEQLQSTNSTGESTYKDQWGKALDKLATFGTVDPADMTAILNTDNPAKVLFELGSNPAEYQRLMDLPPAKRLTEIVKISMKETPKAAPNISRAPPPTESVGNRVSPEVDLRSEKTSDSDWYAVRQKQKAERFKEQRALGRR
jgi:hypothetical protein